MKNIQRRDFLKLGAVSAAILTGSNKIFGKEILNGKIELKNGWHDYSPITNKERQAIPSACWQCVTQDPIIGYVEDGRLVKIEGNPDLGSSHGKICAKGQAGINQAYNPDRLLHPMKRVGKRGEGKWQQISWDEALDLIVKGGEIAGRKVKGLKTLRDEGVPEKFMFHYGRLVGTDATLIMDYFLAAYGTATLGDHASICINAGSIAGMLDQGGAGMGDIGSLKMILNFGNSFLEASLEHIPFAQRINNALVNGMKMYTFDTRLSNTAAKSTEWVPLKPGTDMAVVLAMCNVILQEGLYDEEIITKFTNVTVDELKEHCADYTPEWGEKISSVPAEKIRALAIEFARTKPARCTSMRGAFMHYNGVQTQRAITMLGAIAGNISTQRPGGFNFQWIHPFPLPKVQPKTLKIFEGAPGEFAFPNYGVSHQILTRIENGPERPDIYMIYCHNPVYSNGNCDDNARIYKDEEKIPFLIGVDIILSESTELCDLVIPDATYLERWTGISKVSLDIQPEYYIRQPMHKPLGEARSFNDVVCDLARRLDINLGFNSAEEFLRESCNNTPGIKEAGGFEYMKKNGSWVNKNVELVYADRGKLMIKSEMLASKDFPGIATWMQHPEHQNISEDQLILITYKSPLHTQSRTQNCKWLTEIYHENSAWINSKTAAQKGIKTGDKIKIKSKIGEIVITAFVTEGVHPKTVAMSTHGGHWAHGIYASGKKSNNFIPEPDTDTKWWESNGGHPNLIIPKLGDPIAGSMCWNDTVVSITKV